MRESLTCEANILIAGVGGQGTLLAGRLLGCALRGRGLDVKVSEVHGMSQRGGSVVSHVRCGRRVYSPVVDRGEADIVVALEQLEAIRYAPYLREGGLLLMDEREIAPMRVAVGEDVYPREVFETLRKLGVRAERLDARALAERAGSPKAANVALLGRLSRYLPDIPEGDWLSAIDACVRPAFAEANKQAFRLGRAYGASAQEGGALS